jgi:hypothetical protein
MPSWEPQSDGVGDRPLTRALLTQRPKKVYRRCDFCGAPCYGKTCRAHRDLLTKDPTSIAFAQGGTT